MQMASTIDCSSLWLFLFLVLWGFQSSLEWKALPLIPPIASRVKLHTGCGIHVKLAPAKDVFCWRLARWMNKTSELKLEWSGVLCKVSAAQDRVALLTLLCKVNKQKFPARKQEVINSAGRLMHRFFFFFPRSSVTRLDVH